MATNADRRQTGTWQFFDDWHAAARAEFEAKFK